MSVTPNEAAQSKPTGHITIRLSSEANRVVGAKTLSEHAKRNELQALSRFLEAIGNPKTSRVITVLDPEKILEMEKIASQTEFPPLRSLTQYWRIDARDVGKEKFDVMFKEFGVGREVEYVQEDMQVMPAVVTPGDDPYNVGQGYQDAAPLGIDARWMWGQTNGEGAGIGVVDIEGGWNVTHEDLVGKAPTLIHGAQSTDAGWVNHGTAVLGEIAATDNTVGVVGSAPAITSIRMSSIFDAAGTFHVEDAFAAAIAAMTAGEIMLIELQTSFQPMETVDAILDLLRLATSQGILVVEAAGNGNTDLDALAPGGTQRLNRGSAAFIDSGALMVGACVSTVPHDRWWASNFGSRIDCFAWGENVTTCGYGDLDNGGGNPDLQYTDTFQGTSSASPIIVSAAALVQSRHRAASGTFLSPAQMRTILSNPATGTAQGATVVGAIGVMPNLAVIIPTLGIVPDVYMRDAVGDTGATPWTGAISASPDVIVVPTAEINPQGTYGEGSGTENNDALGNLVESGQDNFIYVRVRNRGGANASNVAATVYWSAPATLVNPTLWNLVGTVNLPNVPTGDTLTVSDQLVWANAAIPATGHYCFVAVLHSQQDPAPPVPNALNWNDFLDYIKNNNNVTWRNFNVENMLPNSPVQTPNFPFLMTGAGAEPVPFAFEVERRLPRDAVLLLEGPVNLIMRLKKLGGEIRVDRKRKRAQIVLPALPRIALGTLRLNLMSRLNCRFIVKPGKTQINWGNSVTIRQLFQGEEVGRIMWKYSPEPCLCNDKDHRT